MGIMNSPAEVLLQGLQWFVAGLYGVNMSLLLNVLKVAMSLVFNGNLHPVAPVKPLLLAI